MGQSEFLALLDEIYAAAFDQSLWPDVLHRMSHAVGAVGGLIMPFTTQSVGEILCSPVVQACMGEYAGDWRSRDPRIIMGQRSRVGLGVVSDVDFLGQETTRRDPFYQEFLKPLAFGTCLSHLSVPVPGQTYVMTFQRSLNAEPIDQADRATLDILGRHAARAMTLMGLLGQHARIQGMMASALHNIAAGAILLDTAGSVVFVNAAAETLFDATFGVQRGRLRIVHGQARRALERLVAAVLAPDGRGPGATVLLLREGATRPLLVQGLPLNPTVADRFGLAGLGLGGAILLVHDLSTREAGTLQGALLQLGLTPAQARVAALVGQGLSPSEAAEVLAIKVSTIRQVVKEIFVRLGVARQSQLATLVGKLMQVSGR